MPRKNGSVSELALKIKQAAYLSGTGMSDAEVAKVVERDARTIRRWKQSPIWKAQIQLMQEEG